MRNAKRFFWSFLRDLNRSLAERFFVRVSKTNLMFLEMKLSMHEMWDVIEVQIIAQKKDLTCGLLDSDFYDFVSKHGLKGRFCQPSAQHWADGTILIDAESVVH